MSFLSQEGPTNAKKKIIIIVKMLSRWHVPNLQVSPALDRVENRAGSSVQSMLFGVLSFASSPWLSGLLVSNFLQCLKGQTSVGSKQTPET